MDAETNLFVCEM